MSRKTLKLMWLVLLTANVQAQTCPETDRCKMGPIKGWDLSEGAPIQIRNITTNKISNTTVKKFDLGVEYFGSACPNSMRKPVDLAAAGKFKEERVSPTFDRVVTPIPLTTIPLVRPHTGLDYACPLGHPIHPMADGIVESAGFSSSYGCTIIIYHPTLEVYSRYAHLNYIENTNDCNLNFLPGAAVEMRDVIGECGNTGSVATHLHFEVMSQVGGQFIDPEEFLNNDCMVRSQIDPWALAHLNAEPLEAKLPHDPNAMYGPEGQVAPGQTMAYTVEFENTGDGTAYGVYITDVLEQHLDVANLVFKDAYLVDWNTGVQTPTSFQYAFDPRSGMLTVLAGEFGSKLGGKFTVEVKLKSDTPRGAVVANYATVYFPTALEATRTNSVVSVVPLESAVSYSGFASVQYGDYSLFQATVSSAGNIIPGKSVVFSVGGSSYSAVSDTLGIARTFSPVNPSPGNYELTAAFPGDGYYYLPSSVKMPFRVLKENSVISLSGSNVVYPSTAVVTVQLADDEGDVLAGPETVYLEYRDSETWKALGQVGVSSAPALFEFQPPQPLRRSYDLRARFEGDNLYEQSLSTATLSVIDKTPPVIDIISPTAGLRYAGRNAFRVDYSVRDDLDGSPTSYALLSSLTDGTTIEARNGTEFVPMDLVAGNWQLLVTAADADGNISTAAAGPFEIVHDVLAPHTQLQFGLPVYYSTVVYISSLTAVGFTAYDDLSEPGDNAGLGVGGTFYGIDGAPFKTFLSSFTMENEGFHYITWYSTDVAGNIEAPKTSTVAVDSLPPLTAINSPAGVLKGVDRVFNAAIPLNITSTDDNFKDLNLSICRAAAPIGDCAELYFSTAAAVNLSLPPLNAGGYAEGQYVLRLRATDQAGNVSVAESIIYIGDLKPALALRGIGKPQGVAADAAGSIYASDSQKDRILKFDSSGKYISAFTGGIGGGAGLKNPAGIELDENGYIYVADSGNHRIAVLDPYGRLTMEICSKEHKNCSPAKGGLHAPTGIAVSTTRICAADKDGIKVFDRGGNLLFSIARRRAGEEDERSFDVALDAAGNIYAGDMENGVIVVYDPTGNKIREMTGIERPMGVAAADYLYVSDFEAGRVYKYDFYGVKLLDLKLKHAFAAGIGPDGALYATEREKGTIYKYVADPMAVFVEREFNEPRKEGGKSCISAEGRRVEVNAETGHMVRVSAVDGAGAFIGGREFSVPLLLNGTSSYEYRPPTSARGCAVFVYLEGEMVESRTLQECEKVLIRFQK